MPNLKLSICGNRDWILSSPVWKWKSVEAKLVLQTPKHKSWFERKAAAYNSVGYRRAVWVGGSRTMRSATPMHVVQLRLFYENHFFDWVWPSIWTRVVTSWFQLRYCLHNHRVRKRIRIFFDLETEGPMKKVDIQLAMIYATSRRHYTHNSSVINRKKY